MSALYQLVAQHRHLQAIVDDPEIDPQAIADTIEGLEGEIELKARSVAMVIRNLDAFADSVEAEAKAIAQRAKRVRARAEAVRAYLFVNMQAAGIQRIQCPEFTLTIRRNPPRVEVVDEAEVPDRYRVYPEPPPPGLDRKRLLDELKAGVEIPGVRIAQDERLEIRS